MPITIEIPDDFFDPNERQKFQELLGANTDQEFSVSLNKVVFAALDEYRDMFLGMGLPSRADEIKQFRLYYLVKRYFNGRIPDELEVSTMFQLPESRAKNLILNMLARFRYNLENEILNTLRIIIGDAEYDENSSEYRVYIGSGNMIDELDRIIAKAGVRYRRLTKIRNESNMYAISQDSYEIISRNLNIQPGER